MSNKDGSSLYTWKENQGGEWVATLKTLKRMRASASWPSRR